MSSTCKTRFTDYNGLDFSVVESNCAEEDDDYMWLHLKNEEVKQLINGKGWTPVEFDRSKGPISLGNSLHLNRKQAAELAGALLRFANTGYF